MSNTNFFMATQFDPLRRIGLPTFLKTPISEDLEDINVGFIGIPWDGTIYSNPGTRFGPREIRNQSMRLSQYSTTLKVNPFKKQKMADCGDVVLSHYSIQKTLEAIYSATSSLLARNILPISVGGDHFVTYPLLKSVAKKHGPLAVVHFDAHSDTEDEVLGEKYTNGTVFRRAIEDEIIIPEKLIQVGIRKFFDEHDLDYHAEHGIRVISNVELKEKGVEILTKELERLRDNTVYVTFDIDFIDPAYAPGTGSREAFGVTSFEAAQCIHSLKGLNIVGMDLVEVSPACDIDNMTTWLAAQLLFEMVCVLP